MVSTLGLLLVVGFTAEINAGQVIGSVATARAGAKQGWAFVGGTLISRLVQALAGAGFATAVADKVLGQIRLGQVAYALIALAGLAAILEGVRMEIRRRARTAPQAERTGMTKRIGVGSALASGFLVNIIYLPNWIYTSLAATNIAALNAGWVVSALLFLVFLLSSMWLGVWLSSLRLAQPGRATAVIDRVGDWTDAHAPLILVVIVLAAGVAMIVFGLLGAFGHAIGR